MKTYQTTTRIMSLDGSKVIGARATVTPAAFAPARWQRMIEQGVIVEVETAVNELPATIFDNLTIIRGIGNERQNELTALGIRTFEQLASASVDDLLRDMEVSKRTITGWQKQAREQNA